MNSIDVPVFDGTPLDTTTIPQRRLNIADKNRSNLFPWNGQFSPQLIEVLLETYAPASAFVLDPFVGSGTGFCTRQEGADTRPSVPRSTLPRSRWRRCTDSST